ncbi:S9 family peptidase [Chloroflexi bacterium TSY]|nr:S9 family peptidase [Chloroflexi bacterium TSY]
MNAPTIAPYGTWTSPITGKLLAAVGMRFQGICIDGDRIYWNEMRPTEEGRYVIVGKDENEQIRDITPQDFNVRTRVHEYGGGSFITHDEVLFFVNFADQRLYRQQLGTQGALQQPEPLTSTEGMRYADMVFDSQRQRLICVREDHSNADQEAVNTIVAVDLTSDSASDLGNHERETVLISGHDFYSSPCLSPDGKQLAWVAWNHPEMPWTNSELWVGEIDEDGSVIHLHQLAGGQNESVFQPTWSPSGTLYFVSDRAGWWNLYRWQNGSTESVVQSLPDNSSHQQTDTTGNADNERSMKAVLEAEFGIPQWSFDSCTYGFRDDNEIICSYTQQGRWFLARLESQSGKLTPYNLPYTHIQNVQVAEQFAVFEGASPTTSAAVVKIDLASGQHSVLQDVGAVPVQPGYLSIPKSIEFPTEDGLTAHGIYYPPVNRDFTGPADERPPLIVISHGGPTGSTSSKFDLKTQYWTSRGFAVLDVNYGGSTGYGRAYRQRLDGQWGIVDVNDCANGALFLAEQGEVDGERLVIRGGSAGGYTTLAALAFRDVFKAGASHFGVSDLAALAAETHKFESRYLDNLVGPYPAQEALYRERSPIHHADKLSCPVIFFQGLEDKIVLPNQAEMMVDALRQKGIPVAYLPFGGEQHGFRQAKNIIRAHEAELYFYARVFGFELPNEIEPVEIENLN